MLSTVLIVLLAAGAVALAVALVATRAQASSGHRLVEELRGELEAQRDTSVRAAVDSLVTMAREQLGAQSAANLAQLDSRNQLMDQRIDGMHREIDKVATLVKELERDRSSKFGALTEQLAQAGQTTAELAKATRTLREALASSQSRGQWGERMADDVLRAAGFVEGINYVKQASTKAGRPDFTFLLPGDKHLHMDVKFPLDNYLRLLETEADLERAQHEKAFLRDVRNRVKELAGRDYIDPAAGTLDYVLLFIPNEHVYSFVHDRDRELVDVALAQKVILCSPLTLFAVLAVVRQAVDSFALEQATGEILELLESFRGQWDKFTSQMDTLGDRLDSTRRAYDQLSGTRRRQLERQLDKIDDLRRADQPAAEPRHVQLAPAPADRAAGA